MAGTEVVKKGQNDAQPDKDDALVEHLMRGFLNSLVYEMKNGAQRPDLVNRDWSQGRIRGDQDQ